MSDSENEGDGDLFDDFEGFDTIFDGSSATIRPENGGAANSGSGKEILSGETVIQYQNAAEEESSSEKSGLSGSVLYFDIETIPDYDRQHLFSLPPLPVVPAEIPVADLLTPTEFLSQTLTEIAKWFARNNPCEDWLASVEDAERKGSGKSGNRKGCFDAIDKARESKGAVDIAIRANRKKMSVTPEMCKIVAMSFAIDDQQVISLVAGEDGVTEQKMIETFWSLAKKTQHFCGFNVAGFDLPTIFIRSILLGVPASRRVDTSPYKSQVIDLMVSRFGRQPATGMGLKNIAKLCDIHVPCEGVDGSQVEELYRTNPALVGEYCASDVQVTRKLHRLYSGFFCL